MKVVQQSAELVSITPDAAKLIERCGRVCYKSEERITEESAAAFIKMLLGRGHLSVLEHAAATFRLVTDRGVSHELVRHRLCAFSQESTRYVNYKDGITVVAPPGLEDCIWWLNSMDEAETAYGALCEDGKAPQIARSVLPTCLKTEIIVTANFREWMHILKLRTAKTAHPQMQELMGMVKAQLIEACPEVFS